MTIHKMSTLTSTCPESIQQGVSKDITMAYVTPGTPPYNYKLYDNNSLVETYPVSGKTNESSHIFQRAFVTLGIHDIKIDATDSCTNPGPKIVSETCTFNVTVEEGGGTGSEGKSNTALILVGAGALAIAFYVATRKKESPNKYPEGTEQYDKDQKTN